MNAQTNPARDVRIRVVVGDDHRVIRGMVRSALQQHPHFEVCGEAENGAEAIQEVKRVRPDVVVLNVTMPLVNGFQAAQEIKKQVPETAIVILSSHADKYFIAEGWCASICPEIEDWTSPRRSFKSCNFEASAPAQAGAFIHPDFQ
jgi:CheY-like chemotaxis protein